MAEINPIQGPIGPKGTPEKREKHSANLEKFKEEKQKIEEISGVDPEGKSKKKRQDADDDETEGIIEQTTPLVPSRGDLQSSPYEVQAPSSKASPKPASAGGGPLKESYTPTAPLEPNLGDEGGFGDEEDFLQSLPSVPQDYQSQPPKATPQPAAPVSPPSDFESPFSYPPSDNSSNLQQPPNAPPPASNDNQSSQAPPARTIGPSQAPPAAEAGHAPSSVKKLGEAPHDAEGKKKQTLPKQPPIKAETEKQLADPSTVKKLTPDENPVYSSFARAPVAPSKDKAPATKEKITADEPELEAAISAPTPISSQGSELGDGKKEKNKDDTISPLVSTIPDMTQPLGLPLTPPADTGLPIYTSFPPAILEMFEKMVSTIEVLQMSSGERKTTITLTSSLFASSVFNGAEIVIEEDTSSAPGQYNIKLLGSPEAVSLFQANMNDLVAAFQSGNYTFKVHRLEAAIQSADRPLFKRKEKTGGEESPAQGQSD